MRAAKDPRRQLQGAVSKAKGKEFEDRLDKSFAHYRAHGFAIIEKTPEPMRPVKSLGNGRFEAFFEKKAQPDYKGTIKGGRTVMFEAKFTGTGKDVGWKGLAAVPWRQTREEAQADLDQLAQKKGWRVWNG